VIYEEVHITVDPEKREEFVTVYRKAWKDAAFEGSHLGKIMREIEDPSKIAVLIEWDELAAHRQHRGSAKSANFRAAIDPYMKHWAAWHYEYEELID
jgi:quinol monooxygenase YgiN